AGTPPVAGPAESTVAPVTHPEQGAVPPLKPGGTVAVIAPASPAPGKTEDAAAWLRARGFVPRLFPASSGPGGDYLAAADSQRLDDLHAAFADTAIDAIICLRGGYGSERLLDRIDYDLIGRHPKPFVGYSNITALLLALSRYAGFVTFHGPMLAPDLLVEKQAPTEDALWALLQGKQKAGSWLPHPPQFPLETIHAGVAQGRLVGGNLATIGATLGTPYEIDLEGAILFIEDVGETPQKIDRLLTQLRLAGKLAQARGILVGDFSEIDDPRAARKHDEADRGRLRQVWKELLEPLQIPVLAGWRSGHCDPNLTLPIGAIVRLDADRQRLRLEQDAVRRDDF
ncbi:MAG: LD-carboxypeptidase, partial [Burkholderiaceae bacterium]